MAAFRAYAVRVLGRIRLFGADGFLGVQRQVEPSIADRPGIPRSRVLVQHDQQVNSAHYYMSQPPSRSDQWFPSSVSLREPASPLSCCVESQLHHGQAYQQSRRPGDACKADQMLSSIPLFLSGNGIPPAYPSTTFP